MKLLRRLLAFLFIAAYVGAAGLAPVVYADTAGMGSGTMPLTAMHHDTGQGGTMPCSKGMANGCYSELGCVFLVAAPAAQLSLVTTTAWSSVTYIHAAQSLRGRSIEPALGPPISLA